MSQGDIFRSTLVAPLATTTPRIFRTGNGDHGSKFFAEQGHTGKIFGEQELESLVASRGGATPTAPSPFSQAPNGVRELIVTQADIFRYFAIASQTCDIAGDDHDPLPTSIILPIKTTAEICRGEMVSFPDWDSGEPATASIDVVLERLPTGEELKFATDVEYSAKLRKLVADWEPEKKAKYERECKNKIVNFLNTFHKSGLVYSIPADHGLSVPECIVLLNLPIPTDTQDLAALKSLRIARLDSINAVSFARAFTDRISRIALPKQDKVDYQVQKK